MKSVEYKSPCRACGHKHESSHCNGIVKEKGIIKLKPFTYRLWDDEHGDKQGFEYEMEFDCRCKCYIPSENLEYLEWKYDESN
jgi:hypothetical protein